MYIEHSEVCKFIYGVNKETKNFIETNFNTIRNGFINEGLITYVVKCDFDGIMLLEELYFQALGRNHANRVISVQL
jgi:hypothetical protein